MENQVPEKIKTSRSAAIRELSEENQKNYYTRFLGLKERVLIEKIDKNGFATGYGEHYIPFRFKANGLKKNTFQTVRAIRVEGEGDKIRLFGEPE
jgi:threonylcarbamoyladenosine tRNA methylthiotransferase MtaB